MLEQQGDHLDRPLFTLSLADYHYPDAATRLPTPHFLCLLAADFRAASDGEITRLAKGLLDSGASYFVCWGPGCERAHDLIDDLTLLLDPPVPDDSVIMTTWHEDQPLNEALFFVLCSAWPDPAYEPSTGCTLGVSVGSPEFASEIRHAFADPDDFVARAMS